MIIFGIGMVLSFRVNDPPIKIAINNTKTVKANLLILRKKAFRSKYVKVTEFNELCKFLGMINFEIEPDWLSIDPEKLSELGSKLVSSG